MSFTTNYPHYPNLFEAFVIKTGPELGIGEREGRSAVQRYELNPCYPNPFNASTLIQFDMPRTAKVNLEVFDIQGRLVKTLASRVFEAGRHLVPYDARGLVSGMYIVRMTSGGYSISQKMVLLK